MEAHKMKKPMTGFTLMELMIAVVVVGILAAIAIPAYQSQIQKTRRADAQGALSGFANAMERRFTDQNTYTGAANGGGDTGSPASAVFPSEAPLDGGDKYYDLTISAAATGSYTLRATPKGAQAGNGILELDSSGARRWDRDNDADLAEASDQCWETTC